MQGSRIHRYQRERSIRYHSARSFHIMLSASNQWPQMQFHWRLSQRNSTFALLVSEREAGCASTAGDEHHWRQHWRIRKKHCNPETTTTTGPQRPPPSSGLRGEEIDGHAFKQPQSKMIEAVGHPDSLGFKTPAEDSQPASNAPTFDGAFHVLPRDLDY